jgi:hypothetical protein
MAGKLKKQFAHVPEFCEFERRCSLRALGCVLRGLVQERANPRAGT